MGHRTFRPTDVDIVRVGSATGEVVGRGAAVSNGTDTGAQRAIGGGGGGGEDKWRRWGREDAVGSRESTAVKVRFGARRRGCFRPAKSCARNDWCGSPRGDAGLGAILWLGGDVTGMAGVDMF